MISCQYLLAASLQPRLLLSYLAVNSMSGLPVCLIRFFILPYLLFASARFHFSRVSSGVHHGVHLYLHFFRGIEFSLALTIALVSCQHNHLLVFLFLTRLQKAQCRLMFSDMDRNLARSPFHRESVQAAPLELYLFHPGLILCFHRFLFLLPRDGSS